MKTSLRFVLIAVFLFTVFLLPSFGQTKNSGTRYKNPKLPIEQRVKDLLSRMTVEEKIAQLQCEITDPEGKHIIGKNGIGGLGTFTRRLSPGQAAAKANRVQQLELDSSRLGIPIIIHDEALHGLVGTGATSFPQAIGLASTWDPDLMEKISGIIAEETRSRGIRQVLSPVVNVVRDVRWGRVEETYGEDPYLSARMGVAFCKPLEQAGIVTTPKHFVDNVGEGGRDSYPILESERKLREVDFVPFKACFQEANATSVMASYNSYDGLPCSSNPWLLTDVLRNEWGFKGYVVSDYGSVGGIMDMHHTAGTQKATAQQALDAGLDVELPGVYIYGKPLLEAVNKGLIKPQILDNAVRRVLAVKFRLGLFDNPFVDTLAADKANDNLEHRHIALQAAREAMTLLKNDNATLPLNKGIKSIAVIGPNADAIRLGGYSGTGMKVVTVLDGVRNKVAAACTLKYAKGCDLSALALPVIPSKYLICPDPTLGLSGLKGEYFNNATLSGTPVLVRLDPTINFDWGNGSPDAKVHSDSFSIRWTGKLVPAQSGRYRLSISSDDGVRLTIGGKLVVDSWFDRGETADYVTIDFEAGKQYDVKIEYYENMGDAAAKFGWDFQEGVDHDFLDAVTAAKNSDAAIFVAGILEGEGRDRADLDLSETQEKLIRAIAKVNSHTVVVLMTGSAVTMNNWIDGVPAILQSWYAGEEGGKAIADVLFGDYTPGGKIPITFPITVGQEPLYYSHKPTGRGDDYVTTSGKPLFPFGFGLSYTTFEYSNLNITPAQISPSEAVTITVDVKNTGKVHGDEIVQLYTHTPVASVTRPLKELKGFKRVGLDPGEKKSVSFTLDRQSLEFLNQAMKPVVEPGTVEVMIGTSSADIKQRGSFTIAAEPNGKRRR
ncbi:MAG: glycoside hydrolase family 3 N-terminal domain-containing protein [Bacteroidota bacterium]